MNVLKITRLEPCEVASFHVRDSLEPEHEVFDRFQQWAEARGLLPRLRFLPVLGFNYPWGREGELRGYEILCFVDRLGDVDLSDVTVKDFPGGLFAVTTIPGIDVIREYAPQLREAIRSHPRYEVDYPKGYRHGVDPSPEYEMVYTIGPQKGAFHVMDYFIPIRERA